MSQSNLDLFKAGQRYFGRPDSTVPEDNISSVWVRTHRVHGEIHTSQITHPQAVKSALTNSPSYILMWEYTDKQ